MGSRMKEDERIERVIRSLLKLPENRRCINCNSLVPQYVCTTFWTFVCTNCSGIQREFNHRVKSVSMAKFTAEEVSALQAGGNERAKQIYFKEWDPQRHSYPDSCNIPRLRDFIKNVYVDRKFTGERRNDNLPRLRLNDKEESYESRKTGSKIPVFYYEDRYERSYSERSSPRYASRHGRLRGSPIKLEVVDDRFRDDEFRSRRLSNLESKKVAPATVSGKVSVEENPAEPKNNNPGSLIILSNTSQVSDAAAGPPTQPTSQSNGSDWAPFEDSTAEEAPLTPNTITLESSTPEMTPQTTEVNALEFLLYELSGPLFATTCGMSQVPSASSDNVPSTATLENVSAGWDLPPTPTSVTQTTASPNNNAASSVTSPTDTELAQPSVLGCSSATKPMSPPFRAVTSNNQPTVSPNTQDLSSAFTELSSQATSKPSQDTRSDVGSQPCTVETKSNGRMELPADLFTTNLLSGPAPLVGWQNVNVQPHNMGFSMQYYPNAVPLSAFPTAAKYTNPFDITEGRTQVHSLSFPSMASLQGVLPATPTGTGMLRASSLGSLGSMVPQSPNHASPMPPQSPFASGFPAGAYFEHVNNNMQPPRPRRAGSFNSDRTVFESPAGGYMAPSAPNSCSKTGGNPFG